MFRCSSQKSSKCTLRWTSKALYTNIKETETMKLMKDWREPGEKWGRDPEEEGEREGET